MRQRTKMNGLVSHTKPSGASYQSGKNKCEQNIKKLQKLVDDGWKITGANVKRDEEPKQVVVTLGGAWKVTLSYDEYKQRGAGLKIILKIY